jgi:hypothetical protein
LSVANEQFWDGGLVANNPSMIALIEVLGLSYDGDDISLISIGSGILPKKKIEYSTVTCGFLRWKFFTKLLLTLLTQTEVTEEQTRDMADHLGHTFFRFNPILDEYIKVDEWKVARSHGKRTFETLKSIETATQKYLSQPDVVLSLRQCAEHLAGQRRLRI